MRRSGCRAGGTSLEHERTEQRRVERRPAPRERAFANGEPASVEPVAELPVAVDSERDPGDREREQQSSRPEPADDQRPGCEDEWNGDGADDSPRARRGRMALERRVQPCLRIEL